MSGLIGPSPDALRRCAQCVLPETYPGISFDTQGVCNCCRQHQATKTPMPGPDVLREKIEKYKTRGEKYEAIVALSGGRDSSYSLYYAVRKLNLKVLAFTIDNGFVPPETWENVNNAVQILGVDHVVIRHDLAVRSIKPLMSAWIRHPNAAMISFMCLGCRLGMRKGFLEVARRYPQIGMCITGGGEPEESMATAFFSTSASRWKRIMALTAGVAGEMLRNPRYLIPPTLPVRMVLEFLYEYPPTGFIRRLVTPKWRFVQIFSHLEYDENHVMDVITNELKWKKYEHSAAAWRSDCKINLVKNAFYQKMLGFTKNDELASGLVRQGKITREQAVARLKHDNVITEEFLRDFFAEIGVKYDQK